MIGFAIGNGVSRVGFDLNILDHYGVTVGCNNLYEEYTPDYIVTLDLNRNTQIIADMERRPFKWIHRIRRPNRLVVDDDILCGLYEINGSLSMNSGIVAAGYLAKYHRCEQVYLIGVDFNRPVPDVESNDIYSESVVNNLVDSFVMLAINYPDVEFIRVGSIPDYDKEFYDKQVINKGIICIDRKAFEDDFNFNR